MASSRRAWRTSVGREAISGTSGPATSHKRSQYAAGLSASRTLVSKATTSTLVNPAASRIAVSLSGVGRAKGPGAPGSGGGSSMCRITICIARLKNGQRSAGPQVLIATRPPGLSARYNVRRAATGSGIYMRPCRHVAASKLASGTPSSNSFETTRYSTLVRPCSFAHACALRTMGSVMSRPTTYPRGPTRCARVKEGSPLPHARSSTRCPEVMSAMVINRSVIERVGWLTSSRRVCQPGAAALHSSRC